MTIAPLPPEIALQTPRILLKLNSASRALGELKGAVQGIPNPDILISTLPLQEAKASSAVENIVTTQDDVYRPPADSDTPEGKEVRRYADALYLGYHKVVEQEALTCNTMIELCQKLMQREYGFRTQTGTVLKNAAGETVYEPPQNPAEVRRLMHELEAFINQDKLSDLDPLIKMALIHHQFESIHPFFDGNGRVGRIINILYLVKTGLLNLPILYLSRGIQATKGEYYRLLQAVRTHNAWEDWVCYMLDQVQAVAKDTLKVVNEIGKLLKEYKDTLRKKLPKIYSQDLLNHLFSYPYTRIRYLEESLGVSYLTARAYLKQLSAAGLLKENKLGSKNLYVNQPLMEILSSTEG